MTDLIIRIKKKTDGSAALSCQRADGSVTWQRQDGLQGGFFPRHDLTHYAVETVLRQVRGFYSLVAGGGSRVVSCRLQRGRRYVLYPTRVTGQLRHLGRRTPTHS